MTLKTWLVTEVLSDAVQTWIVNILPAKGLATQRQKNRAEGVVYDQSHCGMVDKYISSIYE